MNYLIDTDTLIYSLKNHPRVTANFAEKMNAPKALSVISYGEMIFGANKSSQREKNLAVVHRTAEIFPVIPISPAIMETFGELKAVLVQSGQKIADLDLMIASTAITHNLVLVTNNEKHFRRIPGLDLENWTRE